MSSQLRGRRRVAPNAFIIYRSELLPSLADAASASGLQLSSSALSGEVARMWNALPDSIQSRYRLKSRRLQQRYDELAQLALPESGDSLIASKHHLSRRSFRLESTPIRPRPPSAPLPVPYNVRLPWSHHVLLRPHLQSSSHGDPCASHDRQPTTAQAAPLLPLMDTGRRLPHSIQELVTHSSSMNCAHPYQTQCAVVLRSSHARASPQAQQSHTTFATHSFAISSPVSEPAQYHRAGDCSPGLLSSTVSHEPPKFRSSGISIQDLLLVDV
ncbi:hypothetical protein BC830DRAFT_498374 [Chytriomyces sp. MP71]|nr:hypothetical protein BC830DRAFT_498374 [Chytriomyces sp. MP71]